MAPTPRPTPHAVADEDRAAEGFVRALELKAREFDFFHALRCLEAIHRERPRLGTSKRSSDDPVRLGQNPQLGFPPSALDAFVAGTETRPAQLLVMFLGLWGANGPLPHTLTEYARDRLANAGDPTLARFVDIFQHRLLTLFYRAWATAQPAVQLDRSDDDAFTATIDCIAGVPEGGAGDDSQHCAPGTQRRRYFAAHHALPSRPAGCLRTMIAETFGAPTRIDEFQGEWLPLQPQQRFQLGHCQSSRLGYGSQGSGAVVGDSVYQRQHRFRVTLGPLSRQSYIRFLPTAEGSGLIAEVNQLIHDYVGDELTWEIALELDPTEASHCALGTPEQGSDPTGVQLGWYGWLSSTTNSCASGGGVWKSSRFATSSSSTPSDCTPFGIENRDA